MRIPKSLKIGGKIYTVEITDRLTLGSANYSGEILYSDLIIRICPAAKGKMEADFIHEVIHGLFAHLGYSDHDEKKVEERVVPGTKGQMKRKVEVSTVVLVRKADGKKIAARLGERRVPVERQVELVFRRGAEKSFTVKAGDKIKLFSREYQIVSLGGDVKSPEVKIADGLTKIETIITNNGKKQ